MKLSEIKHQLVSFLFPPLCLHCKAMTEANHLFCSGCLPYFELLDSSRRCHYCYKEMEKKGCCETCLKEKRWNLKVMAAFSYQGPPATLVKQIKNGDAPYLAKTAAAWLALQFAASGWPQPDFIIPVPAPWIKSLWKGKDHAAHLADELGLFIKTPVIQPLKRKSGELPQGKRSLSQRVSMSSEIFELKKSKYPIADKTLLLVDDVMTTGTTLRCVADALKKGCPHKIYALTVCR